MSGTSAPGAIVGLTCGAALLLMLSARRSVSRPGRRPRRGAAARLFAAAGVRHASVSAFAGISVVCGLLAGAAALAITALPVVALIAASAAAAIPSAALRRRATVRARLTVAAWPEAVDALVSGVRAGMSLGEALSDLGRTGPPPLRSAFLSFADAYRATGSFDAAVDELQDTLSDPIADRVVAALRLTRDYGGTDLGVVLRSLGSMLRQDARVRGEIEARQSWTVTAARLAVTAPWLTLALLCTRPEGLLAYQSTGGLVVLVLATVLSVLAYAAMVRIGRLPSLDRLIP